MPISGHENFNPEIFPSYWAERVNERVTTKIIMGWSATTLGVYRNLVQLVYIRPDKRNYHLSPEEITTIKNLIIDLEKEWMFDHLSGRGIFE